MGYLNQTLGLSHCFCRNPNRGLVTKARGYNVASQDEALGRTKMWGNKPSHSQGNSHFGELESQWTPKFSEDDFKGQNSMDWKVHYIIGSSWNLDV